MDNLLNMFKTTHETTGKSSGTVPLVADVEALPICFAVLMAEDDDPRYISQGHLEENPKSILTTKEITGWEEEFELPTGMEVRSPYPEERADNPCEGWLVIYEIVFLSGLTFPIPWLALAVLAHNRITWGQPMPNLWRAILGVQGLADREDLMVSEEDF